MAHQGLSENLRSIWETKAAKLIQGQVPVVIDSSLPVEQAAMVLVTNGISSAPVYNKAKSSFVGMFDYQDLVAYLVKLHEQKTIKEDEEELQVASVVGRIPGAVSVKSVSDLSLNNPFYTITHDTALSEVMDIFVKGIHRVVVMEGTKLIGILTQSNVAAFLFNHIQEVPCLKKHIKQLDVVNDKVTTVQSDKSVWHALKLMNQNKFTSLPIIDKGGVLVGSVSLSDVKFALKRYNLKLFFQNVFHFMQQVRNDQGIERGYDSYPVFEVTVEDTLSFALGKMTATKAHRVWVVNSLKHCVGVVTLTDALKAVASECLQN